MLKIGEKKLLSKKEFLVKFRPLHNCRNYSHFVQNSIWLHIFLWVYDILGLIHMTFTKDIWITSKFNFQVKCFLLCQAQIEPHSTPSKTVELLPNSSKVGFFLEKLHLSHMILSQINLNLRKVWFSLVSRWCSSFVLYQTLLDSKLCPTFQGFHPYLRNCSQCHIQFKYKIIWCSVLSHVHKYNEWT